MEKKPYTAPRVTEHGDIVEQTRGMGGENWEVVNPKLHPDMDAD